MIRTRFEHDIPVVQYFAKSYRHGRKAVFFVCAAKVRNPEKLSKPIWNASTPIFRTNMKKPPKTDRQPPSYSGIAICCTGLLPVPVQRMGLVGRFPEVDPREVDTADRIVVGGLVIDPAVGQVDSRGPLRGARNVRTLAFGMFDTDGNVEIVEQVEALLYGLEPGGALRSRGAVEGGLTKRDGGVASPGRPRNPELPPVGRSVTPSSRRTGASPDRGSRNCSGW